MMAVTFTLNGKWKHVLGKEWSYVDGTAYITCVRKNIGFEEMKEKIYKKIGIDHLSHDLNIKLLYTTGGIHQTVPVDICDDDSWFGYLCEKKENKPMKLCVDVKQLVTTQPSRPVATPERSRPLATPEPSRPLATTEPSRPFATTEPSRPLATTEPSRPLATTEPPSPFATTEPSSPVCTGLIIDLNDDNIVQSAEPQNLSPPRVPDFIVGNGLFDASYFSEDDTNNDLPNTSFTELLAGHSNQPFNDAGTRLNTPSIPNCTVPTIPVDQFFASQNLEARDTHGSRSIHGCSDLGNFGDDLTELEIPLCPRTGTITIEDVNSLYAGRLFKNKDELRDTMQLHALKNRYEFRLHRSDTQTYHLKCLRSNCIWNMKAKKANGEDAQWFKIIVYEEKHTCGLEHITNEHAQAKPSSIGRLVRDDIIQLKGKYKAKNVQVAMEKEFGISLTYDQAYRSIQESIRMIGGTPEQSFGKLAAYFHMLKEANKDSLVDIFQDDVGRFKYCFMSLAPSIVGFKFCRPILCVDGCHLKTVYGGTVLVAVGVDAGDHLFPLAVGVADGESIDSWTYFFNHLKKVIGERADIHDLAFVSDRNQAIKTSLTRVFPNAYHGFCYHHLDMNVNDKFTLKKYCPVTLKKAAYTCSKREFEILFDQIKQKNAEVHAYLEAVGVKYWARSHFPGTRYAIMTSNYAESFNALLVEARKMNITNMFEQIRKTLQQWYHERREKAYACSTVLAPEIEENLRKTVGDRINFTLCPIDAVEFQVKDLDSSCRVNLDTKTCYCGEWEAYRLPCAHAALAITKRHLNLYNFCDPYYKAECFKRIYEGRVFPVPHEKDWNIPENIRKTCVLPPIERNNVSRDGTRKGKKRGRRATKRIPSKGERSSSQRVMRILSVGKPIRKCSLCKEPGHRKDKCPTPLSLA